MHRTTRHLFLVLLTALLAALAATVAPQGLAAPAASLSATGTATTFSGRAVALQGTIANTALTGPVKIPCFASAGNPGLLPTAPSSSCKGIADTGELDVTAPEPEPLERSAACYAVPDNTGCLVTPPNLTGNTLSAEALRAAVVARGNRSSAEASVANFSLNVGGFQISADVLDARAEAKCTGSGPVVSAGAETSVTINGDTHTVAAGQTQTIDLVDPLGVKVGYVIINPGASGSRSGDVIDAAALRIVIPATGTDITVAEVHADIVCGRSNCPNPKAFVTSGGFILSPTGAKLHFAVAGRNMAQWGHVLYRPAGLHVKDPWALVFGSQGDLEDELSSGRHALTFTSSVLPTDPKSKFQGSAIVYWTTDGNPLNATGSNLAGEVLVIDMGEPGQGRDFFEIASIGPVTAAAGLLAGGNIQMHGDCR